jgi:hypothetical protein
LRAAGRSHTPSSHTLPKSDPGRRPAKHGPPPGKPLDHLEVVHTSDVLDDAAAGVTPDVDAKGEIRFVFMGKSDSTRPRPALFIRYVVAS